MNVAEAKARWSEVIARAEKGETIDITRRGKPVARLVPADAPDRPRDADWLIGLTDGEPMTSDSVALVRAIREEED